MSSDQMFWTAVYSTLMTVVIAPLIGYLISRRKTRSEVDLNIAQSANEIMEGGEKAVAAFTKLLEHYQKITDAQGAQIAEQNRNIDSLKATIVSLQIDGRQREANLLSKIDALMAYIRLLTDILSNNNMKFPTLDQFLAENNPRGESKPKIPPIVTA